MVEWVYFIILYSIVYVHLHYKQPLKLQIYNKSGTGGGGHPGVTRVRSIRFLLFEIKRVLVYNSTSFKLTDLFILYFFIQNVYANKKVFKKNAE